MKINYWLAGGVLLLWLAFAVVPICFLGGAEKSGVWGDTFGAFSALVNGIGFIALYSTINLQRETMDLQRKSMDLQLAFNKDQHKETTFRFLYDHLTTLENDMEGFVIAGKDGGIQSVDYVQAFIQDNRATEKFDHTLNYLLSLYEQFESHHHLLKDSESIISNTEFKTIRARVGAFRARYVKKIAETKVNPQQAGYAVQVYEMCVKIMSIQNILLVKSYQAVTG